MKFDVISMIYVEFEHYDEFAGGLQLTKADSSGGNTFFFKKVNFVVKMYDGFILWRMLHWGNTRRNLNGLIIVLESAD